MKDEVTGQQVMRPTHVYAARTKDKKEYRFHINQYPDLLSFLERRGINKSAITTVEMDLHTPALLQATVKPMWTLHDYQTEAVDYIVEENHYRTKLIELQTGKGKAQSLDSAIRTPSGWVRMGHIQVGASVVAHDGTVTTVTGVYPQGVREMYRITFEDGRRTECCAEHLWRIYRDPRSDRGEVIDTAEIIRLISIADTELYIDLPKPNRNEAKGSAVLRQILKGRVRFNSETQMVEFRTHGRQQALDAQYWVRALGGIAYLSATEGDDYSYLVSMKSAYLPEFPELEQPNKLRVFFVESIGPKEAQCISIAHPDRLYITDDFIVTHNSLSAMAGIVKKGYRVLVAILPRYIEKWVEDLYKTYDIHQSRIMVVQGSGHLRGLISMAMDGDLDVDVIIISTSTYQNWLTDYEAQEFYDYPINPDQLHSTLGTGILMIDETHQHLHSVFRILMYTHTHLLIAMTATLLTDQHDVRVIHDLMYPRPTRFNNLELDNYTDVTAYAYSTHDIKQSGLRTTEWGSNTYSHTAYEKSILQKHPRLERYLAIIDFTIGHSFFDIHMPGDKCAVFCATVRMCDEVVKFLKRKYPSFDVRRYAENDPFENAIEPDIRVTTIGSMGAAVDIKGLRTVVLTVSISSIQANIQVLGRLRKLPDRDVRFAYIYNEDIKKHVDYHRKKRELFQGRVRTHKSLRLPIGM